MRLKSTATMVLGVLVIAYGIKGLAQDRPANGNPEDASKELVGRWALIASMIDGEDVTKGGVTQAGEVAHYTFLELAESRPGRTEFRLTLPVDATG